MSNQTSTQTTKEEANLRHRYQTIAGHAVQSHYPQPSTSIVELLERSCRKYPDKCLVADQGEQYSYQEILAMSKKVGCGIAYHTSPKQPVVLLMDKSAHMLAAMFGIVYAGCFYIPVSLQQPSERIEKILTTSEASLVVCMEEDREKMADIPFAGEVVSFQEMMEQPIEDVMLHRIRKECSCDDLLYVMYTSGSTGVPKGVMVSHRSVENFIAHFVQLFHITSKDIIGNQAPFDFDVSVKDIYGAIASGATLSIIPRDLFSIPPRLVDYLCQQEITTLIWAVPALCIISSMKGFDYRIPTHVNKVLFSGQAMPVAQLRKWQKALPDATYVNLYGPTEITCNCTYHIVRENYQDAQKLPIGEAFPGRRIYLLDEKLQLVTLPGAQGEICVAGESLGEGYYHNPQETQNRFISITDPKRGSVRVYRTGDLASFGIDRKLYFAGRKDSQIKRMGHRIELEEIENVLNGMRVVENSCCCFHKEKNAIYAFYQGSVEKRVLKQMLKTKLPAYMMPNKMIQMEQLPMNKNGKLDKTYLNELMYQRDNRRKQE